MDNAMNRTPEVGCTGIQKALGLEYLAVMNVYIGPDETRPIMVMADPNDDQSFALSLNYCPFCGDRFQDNMPTCAGKIGIERAQIGDVAAT